LAAVAALTFLAVTALVTVATLLAAVIPFVAFAALFALLVLLGTALGLLAVTVAITTVTAFIAAATVAVTIPATTAIPVVAVAALELRTRAAVLALALGAEFLLAGAEQGTPQLHEDAGLLHGGLGGEHRSRHGGVDALYGGGLGGLLGAFGARQRLRFRRGHQLVAGGGGAWGTGLVVAQALDVVLRHVQMRIRH